MRLSAIILARAIGYVETFDLNPKGKVFYPDLIAAIVKRYRFQVFPQKPEEVDEAKGVTFTDGVWDGTNIEKLVIYNTGLLVDTRSSTQDSRRLVQEALTWGRDEFGLVYSEGMIKRWAYISNLTFHSDFNLTSIHPAVEKLARRVDGAVSDYADLNLPYEMLGFNLNVDILKVKYPRSHFLLTRRNETPFSENKYYSESPFQTDEHIKALEEFEAEIGA